MIEIVRKHLERYPLMRARDVYKLIFQASMGMGHLLINPYAEEYFFKEYSSVEADSSLPLFERIHPDNKIFRVNLARIKLEHFSKKLVWELAVKSAGIFKPNEKMLHIWWNQVRAQFDLQDLSEIEVLMNDDEAPAFHHSELYKVNYKPAYRLVVPEAMKDIYAGCSKSDATF